MAYVLFLQARGISPAPDPDLPALLIREEQGRRRALVALRGRWQPASIADDTVTWYSSGKPDSIGGHLFLTGDGLWCEGTVAVGNGAPRAIFGSAIPPTRFALQITDQRPPANINPGSIPPGNWRTVPTLAVGYELDRTTGYPQPLVEQEGQNLSEFVSLAIVKNQLQIQLRVEPAVACDFSPNLLCEFTGVFSDFGTVLSGTVASICTDRSGPTPYLFKGQAQSSLLADLEPPEPAPASSARRTPSRPAEEVSSAGAEQNLSLAELLSLVPDESVRERASEMLLENAKWAIDQSDSERAWLKDLFDQQAPALSPKRRSLVESALGWYQDTFAVGYLARALDGISSGPAAPSVHLDEQQRAKLDRLMTKGMAESPAYATQMQGLAMEAYLSAKPRLTAYVNDASTNWGEELFAALTSPDQLRLTATRIAATLDASGASATTVLLHALDPGGELAKRYQELLLARMLMATSFQSHVDDLELIATWLPDALEAFVAAYEDSENAEAQASAKALAHAAEIFGGFAELADSFARLYVEHRGQGLARQSEEAAAAFARAYPDLAAAGQVMFALAWAGGMLNVVIAFLGWSELDAEAKEKTITAVVRLVGDAADTITGILEGPPKSYEQWIELQDFAASDEVLDDFVLVPQDIAGEDWVAIAGRATGDLFDTEGRVVITAGTRWESILAAAGKVVAGLGVAVAAATAVFSTIDFIDDIREGKTPTKAVLDGILAAASIASAVTLTLGVAVSSAGFMLAASVLAALGAVIVVIELFLPAPSEPSPVDAFMRDHAVPFTDALPAS